VQYREKSSVTASDSPNNPYPWAFYPPRDSVVWAIPAEGEPYRWVDDGRDKIQMQVSPDYSQVAYVVNSQYGEFTSVWVANADGSNPRQLTPDYPAEGIAGHVFLADRAWSPDGQKLAYMFKYGNDHLYSRIYVVDVLEEKVIEMDVDIADRVEWANNQVLRFYLHLTYDEAYEIDIYTQEVTTVPYPSLWQFSGGTVRYEVDSDQSPVLKIMTVYGPDGSEMYQLDLSGWPIRDPTISPDLRWYVFFASFLSGNKPSGIYKAGQDQPQPQLLLRGAGLKDAWSPDGQWFLTAGTAYELGDDCSLDAVNVETGEERKVMGIDAAPLPVEGIDPVVWLK
jgi:Tol biopolymer transport system component